MNQIETSVTINASRHEVWSIFMNHSQYGSWNPFIRSWEGDSSPGETITVKLAPPGKAEMVFTPKVIVRKEASEFRWLGHLFTKGLFDGEHYFILEEVGDNQTRFIQGEVFRGVLAVPIMKMIGENTIQGFDQMNAALKEQLEAKS